MFSTTTGTIHRFDAVAGIDKTNQKGIPTEIRTKLFNICSMPTYERKSMEELRFEDYIDNRKFSTTTTLDRHLSANKKFTFRKTKRNQSNRNFKTTTTFPTSAFTFTDNTSAKSTIPTSPFSFGVPAATTAQTFGVLAATTASVISGSSPSTNLSTSIGNFPSTATCFSSAPLLTFGSKQPVTTTPPSFNFGLALKELEDSMNDINKEKASSVQEQTTSEKLCSRTPSPEMIRNCTDCEKPPQVQCLHCMKQVCMECAQKHSILAAEQIEAAQHVLTEKIGILERLSAAAKERVNIERDKIIQQVDTERDQAYIQIDELFEQQKKQIEDRSVRLHQLPLDKVSSYIQRTTSKLEDLNEDNEQLFCVTCTPSKIHVQHKHSLLNKK